jgi:hypothetical protein
MEAPCELANKVTVGSCSNPAPATIFLSLRELAFGKIRVTRRSGATQAFGITTVILRRFKSLPPRGLFLHLQPFGRLRLG